MYYIALTIGLLFMALSMKGLSTTEIIVIFAIGAPITYFLVRVFCRTMQLRAMRKHITGGRP